MDGFVARRGLIAPERLRPLYRRSDLKGAVQMASHFGAIGLATAGLAATWGTWLALPFFLAQGVLINFLYAAQHELSHSTVFATRRLNEAFGRLIGFIQIDPRDFDQIQHFAHHRHTQDWQKDGELARARYTLGSYLLWLLGPSYWWTRVTRLMRFAAGRVDEPYVRAEDKSGVVLEARLHLAGYAAMAAISIWAGTWVAVVYWLAPMLLTKPVHQLQNTIEHLGLTHAPDTLVNTRTVRTNALMRWLGWNMQYHTAHHTYPAVPFHMLPDLHREIVAQSGREPPTMTYLGFQREAIRTLARRGGEARYPDEQSWIVAPAAPMTNR